MKHNGIYKVLHNDRLMEPTCDNNSRNLSLMVLSFRIHKVARICGAVVDPDTFIYLSGQGVLEGASFSYLEVCLFSRMVDHVVFK